MTDQVKQELNQALNDFYMHGFAAGRKSTNGVASPNIAKIMQLIAQAHKGYEPEAQHPNQDGDDTDRLEHNGLYEKLLHLMDACPLGDGHGCEIARLHQQAGRNIPLTREMAFKRACQLIQVDIDRAVEEARLDEHKNIETALHLRFLELKDPNHPALSTSSRIIKQASLDALEFAQRSPDKVARLIADLKTPPHSPTNPEAKEKP